MRLLAPGDGVRARGSTMSLVIGCLQSQIALKSLDLLCLDWMNKGSICLDWMNESFVCF